MKSVAVAAALVLLLAVGPGTAAAQQRRHRPAPSPPPAPFVPQTLSTGGITTLPPPPRPGPFDARPRTYSPRYNDARPRHRGGSGYTGIPYYDGAVGIGEYVPAPAAVVAPPAEPAVAPAPEPPRAPAPAPEPPRVAVAHGPDTFYLIPGCYAGNKPPDPARLPKNCDLAKLRTLPVR